MISGLWPVVAVGMLGGLVAELLRIIPVLAEKRFPDRFEILISIIYIFLGAGAALLVGDGPETPYNVAVIGAAFPLTFTTAARSFSTTRTSGRALRGDQRTVLDYATSRF